MRYRLLLQLSADGILILDATRLCVVEANPAARSIFGAEIGELAGLGLAEMFSENTVGAVEAHLGAVRAGSRPADVRATTAGRGKRCARDVSLNAVAFSMDGHVLLLLRVTSLTHPASREPEGVPVAARGMPRLVHEVTSQIGRVKLKDLVRDATEVLERHCIETALELTRNNRASAAGLLGLSRQSLYLKLHRYGIGDLTAEADG
ncbi:MAG: PAS domain-containing protein [Acetobacteraceae bacterium]|nr:PAS domain-containing protein [Acetobacteraceae bacterium]